jgi:hypothetical protein
MITTLPLRPTLYTLVLLSMRSVPNSHCHAIFNITHTISTIQLMAAGNQFPKLPIPRGVFLHRPPTLGSASSSSSSRLRSLYRCSPPWPRGTDFCQLPSVVFSTADHALGSRFLTHFTAYCVTLMSHFTAYCVTLVSHFTLHCLLCYTYVITLTAVQTIWPTAGASHWPVG